MKFEQVIFLLMSILSAMLHDAHFELNELMVEQSIGHFIAKLPQHMGVFTISSRFVHDGAYRYTLYDQCIDFFKVHNDFLL